MTEQTTQVAQTTTNEKPKRLYPSTQLLAALNYKVLITYLWILTWGGGSVRYYSRQFMKATGLSEEYLEKCIQALVDSRLITVTNTEEGFLFTPNPEEHQKYFEMPLAQILESKKITMAREATWNKTTPIQKPKFEDMDADQIKALIVRLQASLQEKEQMKKFVKVTSTPTEKFDDLPF